MLSRLKRYFSYTLDSFAKDIVRSLKRAGFAGQVHYDREGAVIRLADGGLISLATIYQELKGLPRPQRNERIDQLIVGMLQQASVPETFEEAAASILPRIRPRVAIECRNLQAQLENMNQRFCENESYVTLADGLCLEYVLDNEHTIQR